MEIFKVRFLFHPIATKGVIEYGRDETFDWVSEDDDEFHVGIEVMDDFGKMCSIA